MAEAADALGTSPQTVRRLLRNGELRGRRQPWGDRFVWVPSREGVSEFLSHQGRLDGRRRKRPATAELRRAPDITSPAAPAAALPRPAAARARPVERSWFLRPRGRAALVVVALGAVAGTGWLTLAAGTGSVVVLALSEKNRLHGLVHHLRDTELHAALRFAVLAVVVLPLLPAGPLFGPLEIRPRQLWIVVLLFCGLNFAGYVARRAVGTSRGYGITGALGGVVSSTAVTLNFSRLSRGDDTSAVSLAHGIVAACTVLIPRVLIVSATLQPAVALALLPRVVPMFIAGAAIVAFAWRADGATHSTEPETKSPLRFANALQMAVAFQVSITAISLIGSRFGATGVYGSAAVLGLTDVDALTVSMSAPASMLAADVAGRALAIGILANTLLKLTIALAIGRPRFRRAAAAGLTGLAVASAAGLVLI